MLLRKDARYDLLAPTSIGLRMTPANKKPIHICHDYSLQATSAESNVLGVPASLGCRTKLLTAFVKDSPLSEFIKKELRSRNIEYEGPERESDGPWGVRHQINFAESGCGVRGARVFNDRAGEVGRTLSAKDFDIEKLFSEEGVRILHMSGLFVALSSETSQFCLELVNAAKKNGTRVSFDMNYRESFWKGREKQLARTFMTIASQADILLNFQPLDSSGELVDMNLDPEDPNTFCNMIRQVYTLYPNAHVLTSTVRREISANENIWGAVMLVDGKDWYKEEVRKISVMDRIGGGDGFASGVLYGILKGYPPEKWIQLGWASGALAVTTENDYIQIFDESLLWQCYRRDVRIKR